MCSFGVHLLQQLQNTHSFGLSLLLPIDDPRPNAERNPNMIRGRRRHSLAPTDQHLRMLVAVGVLAGAAEELLHLPLVHRFERVFLLMPSLQFGRSLPQNPVAFGGENGRLSEASHQLVHVRQLGPFEAPHWIPLNKTEISSCSTSPHSPTLSPSESSNGRGRSGRGGRGRRRSPTDWRPSN